MIELFCEKWVAKLTRVSMSALNCWDHSRVSEGKHLLYEASCIENRVSTGPQSWEIKPTTKIFISRMFINDFSIHIALFSFTAIFNNKVAGSSAYGVVSIMIIMLLDGTYVLIRRSSVWWPPPRKGGWPRDRLQYGLSDEHLRWNLWSFSSFCLKLVLEDHLPAEPWAGGVYRHCASFHSKVPGVVIRRIF